MTESERQSRRGSEKNASSAGCRTAGKIDRRAITPAADAGRQAGRRLRRLVQNRADVQRLSTARCDGWPGRGRGRWPRQRNIPARWCLPIAQHERTPQAESPGNGPPHSARVPNQVRCRPPRASDQPTGGKTRIRRRRSEPDAPGEDARHVGAVWCFLPCGKMPRPRSAGKRPGRFGRTPGGNDSRQPLHCLDELRLGRVELECRRILGAGRRRIAFFLENLSQPPVGGPERRLVVIRRMGEVLLE